MARPKLYSVFVLAASALTVCGLAWLLLSRPPPLSAPDLPVETAKVSAPVTHARPEQTAEPAAQQTAEPTAPPVPTSPIRDHTRAAQLRDALMALHGGQPAERRPETPDRAVPAAPASPQAGSAQAALSGYVQTLLQDHIAPATVACYEQWLVQNPNAAGALFLELAVMSDPAFGGVVAHVGFGEATTLNAAPFLQCVKDAAYSLVLHPPPPGNASFTIEQSFELEP